MIDNELLTTWREIEIIHWLAENGIDPKTISIFIENNKENISNIPLTKNITTIEDKLNKKFDIKISNAADVFYKLLSINFGEDENEIRRS